MKSAEWLQREREGGSVCLCVWVLVRLPAFTVTKHAHSEKWLSCKVREGEEGEKEKDGAIQERSEGERKERVMEQDWQKREG